MSIGHFPPMLMGFKANQKYTDHQAGYTSDAKDTDILLEYGNSDNNGPDRPDAGPDRVRNT
tara:strand:+ start:492 stop:674 length:183 start_codon:yes stop_codon:yes gene_type:complete